MTLVELLVVITILALMAGLVAPRIGPWVDNWKLRGAAERIAQTLRYARARALFEQRYYVVEIFPKKNLVRVLEPDSEFVREFTLPDGIQVEAEDKQGVIGTPEVVRFFLPPSGEFEQKDLWLRNKQGRVVRIHLAFLLRNPGVEIAQQGS
jgi:type II secretory pathway pseudopilin PulG